MNKVSIITTTHKILLLLIGLTSLGIIVALAIGLSLVYSTHQESVQREEQGDILNNENTMNDLQNQEVEQLDPKRAEAIRRAKEMHQQGESTVTPEQRAIMEDMSAQTVDLSDQERLELLQAMQ